MLRFCFLFLAFCFLLPSSFAQAKSYHQVLRLMGTRFEITAIHSEKEVALKAIEAAINEIQRIEKLISSWDDASQTSAINRYAGQKAVKVDRELFELIRRCLKVSKLTDGAFDISFATAENIWQFEGQKSIMPPPDIVAATVQKINYQNILLHQTAAKVELKETGMKIGFGGIGKGYAANRAKLIMERLGISSGVVNAAGDLVCWGLQENGKDWEVGIADPKDEKSVIAWLVIKNGAIVTSGNYEKYTLIDGHRYAHIIDPRTGYPITGIKSVSVICPDPELADALATAIFVLGKEKGLDLINRLKDIDCLIIDEQDQLHASQHLELIYH